MFNENEIEFMVKIEELLFWFAKTKQEEGYFDGCTFESINGVIENELAEIDISEHYHGDFTNLKFYVNKDSVIIIRIFPIEIIDETKYEHMLKFNKKIHYLNGLFDVQHIVQTRQTSHTNDKIYEYYYSYNDEYKNDMIHPDNYKIVELNYFKNCKKELVKEMSDCDGVPFDIYKNHNLDTFFVISPDIMEKNEICVQPFYHNFKMSSSSATMESKVIELEKMIQELRNAINSSNGDKEKLEKERLEKERLEKTQSEFNKIKSEIEKSNKCCFMITDNVVTIVKARDDLLFKRKAMNFNHNDLKKLFDDANYSIFEVTCYETDVSKIFDKSFDTSILTRNNSDDKEFTNFYFINC